MRLTGLRLALTVLLLAGATASFGADYRYIPHPADSTDQEGILVREVTVKRGDTLSRLSKQYAGRGYYYPQILLFNTIRNPHLIYPGQVLRVPLAQKTKPPGPKRSRPEPAAAIEPVFAAPEQKPASAPLRHAFDGADQPVSPERRAFDAAQTAFNAGDCALAIQQYDRFINRYPASALLPEATLNRAECYLKLSAQD